MICYKLKGKGKELTLLMAYLIANNVKIIFFYTSKKELYLSMDLHYM
jgi:hypothetical protein